MTTPTMATRFLLRPIIGRQWRSGSNSRAIIQKSPVFPSSCLLPPTRCLGSGRRRTPGQGGTSEEYYIANAIRSIKDMNPRFVVEVINASNVSVTPKLFPASRIVRNASVVLKVLTHADLLSDKALLYQMAQAQQQHNTAVIALDLTDASKIKSKSLRQVTNALLGGSLLASEKVAVVCGMPNAGKSSFILPLTQHRTLEVKKKRHFHLPKVAPRAGFTLSTKRHVLEVKGQHIVTLVDTPGLRQRMEYVNEIETTALLLATGAMESTKGMLDEEIQGAVVSLLLKALNRHGSFGESPLPYVQALGLEAPIEDPNEFLKVYQKMTSTKGAGLVLELIRKCRTGHFGGLIFEERPGRSQIEEELTVNRNGHVACMNTEAKRWIDIGTGQKEAIPLTPPTPRSDSGNGKASHGPYHGNTSNGS